MRRKYIHSLISFVLVAAILLSFAPAAVAVNDGSDGESSAMYTLSLLYVQAGEDKCLENALRDTAGNWYFTADTIAKYTGYTFDVEEMQWTKYQNASYQTDKKILISLDDVTMTVVMLNTNYPVTASALPVYGGQIWFPICQILPLMETVTWVEDGVLCIETPAVSFEDAFHGWEMSGLMFDEEAEFDGQKWAEAIMIGTAWLYDTVGSLNLSRLFSGLSDGGVEDYETVFTDYLTDTDAYALAFSDTAWVNERIASISKSVSEISKSYGLSLRSLNIIKEIAEAVMIGIGNLDKDDLFLTAAFEDVIPSGRR